MKIKRLIVGDFQTNCYIVHHEKKAIIIDPGAQSKKIKKAIENDELEVIAILLTHGHCDHIGAVDALVESYNCPVYLHQEDNEYLTKPEINLSAMFMDKLIINSAITNPKDIMAIGDYIVKWHHLPGHTPGSSMIEFVDIGIIFSGDVLFNGSIGRFDFPLSSKHDTMQSIEKIKKIDGEYRIYPGHGEATTLINEIQNNPYF